MPVYWTGEACLQAEKSWLILEHQTGAGFARTEGINPTIQSSNLRFNWISVVLRCRVAAPVENAEHHCIGDWCLLPRVEALHQTGQQGRFDGKCICGRALRSITSSKHRPHSRLHLWLRRCRCRHPVLKALHFTKSSVACQDIRLLPTGTCSPGFAAQHTYATSVHARHGQQVCLVLVEELLQAFHVHLTTCHRLVAMLSLNPKP